MCTTQTPFPAVSVLHMQQLRNLQIKSFPLYYSSFVLVHYDRIFNYTNHILFVPQTPPPFHSLCRVKGDAEMNQCSAVNEPIVLQSLASLAARRRRCPVNEAKGCRKRIVHPVLSVPPESDIHNYAINHTNCSSHA